MKNKVKIVKKLLNLLFVDHTVCSHHFHFQSSIFLFFHMFFSLIWSIVCHLDHNACFIPSNFLICQSYYIFTLIIFYLFDFSFKFFPKGIRSFSAPKEPALPPNENVKIKLKKQPCFQKAQKINLSTNINKYKPN